MPINNIKNIEGSYMKINEIISQKPEINKEREVQREKVRAQSMSQETNTREVKDKVELSNIQVIDQAIKKGKDLPEIREEKVEQLRQAIENGTYKVSNRDLARAMVRSLLSEIA